MWSAIDEGRVIHHDNWAVSELTDLETVLLSALTRDNPQQAQFSQINYIDLKSIIHHGNTVGVVMDLWC